jgi:protein-arginine kinase activator protein McsA
VIQLTTMQTYSKKNKKELIAEIQELKRQLSILVNEPDSEEALIIKMQIKMFTDILNASWRGYQY